MKKKFKLKKIILIVLLLLIVSLFSIPFLVSCSSEIGGIVNATTIVNLIFPNIWVFVATIISTIILICAIIWFVWKPLNKKIEERKKYLNQELEDAEKAKQDAFNAKAQAQDEFAKAQIDAARIVQSANQKGNDLYNQLQDKAKEQAYQIVKNAQEEIDIEKRKMQEEMHDQILNIAFDAATHISKKNISKSDSDKMIDEFIDEYQKMKD